MKNRYCAFFCTALMIFCIAQPAFAMCAPNISQKKTRKKRKKSRRSMTALQKTVSAVAVASGIVLAGWYACDQSYDDPTNRSGADRRQDHQDGSASNSAQVGIASQEAESQLSIAITSPESQQTSSQTKQNIWQQIQSRLGTNLGLQLSTIQDREWNIASDKKLIIHAGDITKLRNIGAIVNAANRSLADGSGVCGAIFSAAGRRQLQTACDKHRMDAAGARCPTGQARVTGSFDLKSRGGIEYILHSVGPNCHEITDENEQNHLLTAVYTNTLQLASDTKIESIAFPFISSFIYAFPKKRAAKIACSTVLDYLKGNNALPSTVLFSLFSAEDYHLFNDTIEAIMNPNIEHQQ